MLMMLLVLEITAQAYTRACARSLALLDRLVPTPMSPRMLGGDRCCPTRNQNDVPPTALRQGIFEMTVRDRRIMRRLYDIIIIFFILDIHINMTL